MLCVFGCLQVEFAWGQNKPIKCSGNKISNGTFQKNADGWKDQNNQAPAPSATNYRWYRFGPNRDLRISARGDEQTLTTTAVGGLCLNTPKQLELIITTYTSFKQGSYFKILVGGMEVFNYDLYNSKNVVTGKDITDNPAIIKLDIENYTGNSDKIELKFKKTGVFGILAVDNIKLYEKPTLKVTAPNAMSFCVNSITNANFTETTNGNINTPPDYYKFPNNYKGLDIDINEDCCIMVDSISWKITPKSNGTTISGTGQPSESIGRKDLWLDVAPNNPQSSYTKKEYTITYTVTDTVNKISAQTTTQITIKPRPKIDFVTN